MSRQTFRTGLRWILRILFLLLLVPVLAVLAILIRPELVLNERAMEQVRSWASAQGYRISWKGAAIAVKSDSLLRKRLTFKFQGLCLNFEAGRYAGCFESVEITAAGGLIRLRPRITEAGPIRIKDGELMLDFRDEHQTEKPPPTPPPADAGSTSIFEGGWVPGFLVGARVRPIQIERTRWRIVSREREYDGTLELLSRMEGERGRISAQASVRSRGERARALLELRNPRGFEELEAWSLSLRGDASDGDGMSAQLKADLHPLSPKAKEFRYQYAIAGELRQGRKRIEADVSGEAGFDEVSARLKGSVRNLIPGIELAWTPAGGCELEIRRARGRSSVEAARMEGTFRTDCLVNFRVPVAPSGPARRLGLRLPTEAGVRLVADLATASFPPSPSEPASGSLSVDLIPVRTSLFEARGRVSSRVNGIFSEIPDRFRHETDLDLRLSIPKFHDVAKLLAKTDWAIPAPLAVLRGTVDLRLEGRLDTDRGTVPAILSTRLSSPSQTFNIDASALLNIQELRPSPKIHASFDVLLRDVQLALPRMDLNEPPRLLPDPRVRPKAKALSVAEPGAAGKVPPSFTYDLKISTLDQKPLRILSNLAQSPIPIRIALEQGSDIPLSGAVQVRNFPIQVFRREATVDHLDLQLAEPTSESAIDGALRVAFADYTVTVLLLGTAGKPVLKLTSNPPLPEDQIVAVLLYGRPIEELDTDESQSVGSTQAAIADQALGLLSLYALASTPIQSVGYDPQSGEMLVKVRLGEGTSLNLGIEPGGVQEVGIRRRLSEHWAITTDLNTPVGENDQTVVSAFLEWSYRY